jgi:proline iminopeptidase
MRAILVSVALGWVLGCAGGDSRSASPAADAPPDQLPEIDPVPFVSAGDTLISYPLGPVGGTPFILLSGGPGFDSKYFRVSPVWRTLAKTRRVVIYDQRGTGRSSPIGPGDTITMADEVADLEALRQSLGAERIDLFGHSFGGYFGMTYAAKHGDRIAHLILAGSAAPKFSETIFLFDQAFPEKRGWQEDLRRGQSTGDSLAIQRALAVYLSMIWYDPANRDRFLPLLGAAGYHERQGSQLSAEMAATDLTPALAGFRFPVLVLNGRYDMNVAALTGYRIHQAIPGSRFVIMEKSSHMMFYEEPERFLEIITGFLQGANP